MATGLATRMKYPNAQYSEPRELQVKGNFQIDGTNDPELSVGRGFVVTRTGVGIFLITFPDPYPQMVHFSADFADTAAGGNLDSRYVGEPYDSTAGTIVVRHSTAAVAAEPADNTTCHFTATFQLSNALAVVNT